MDTATSPSISPVEFRARLGRSDTPLILDVRREAAFASSAQRLPLEQVATQAGPAGSTEVIVYCVHGHEVGADAASRLRRDGWNARFLQGGIEGMLSSQQPTLRKREDFGVTGHAASRWITRARPKIDRIACPWLILRFIDPRAIFHYVPTEQVFDQAAALGAVAYDIPGAPISHDGDRCSFDTLLAAFDLHDEALSTLARIVRGADTDRLDLAPQSAGLLAMSLGLSQLHADDHAMLLAALPLYDALYAWCREGRHETHNWKPQSTMGAAS